MLAANGRRVAADAARAALAHRLPVADHTDDPAAHANPFTAEDVTRTKAVMGIPDEPFWAPPEVVDAYRHAVAARGADSTPAGQEALDASTPTSGRRGTRLGSAPARRDGRTPCRCSSRREARHPPGDGQGARCLAADFPGLVSGAADLTGNTGVKLPDDAGQQTAEHPGGRQVYYGIREHAMGAAAVGMAMHGGVLPISGTFFVFLDYMRPPVRLARCRGPRPCSCSATTRSASARTARPTSPSSTSPRCGRSRGCRSSARPTPTRRQRHGGRPSTTTVRPRSCSPARASRCAPTARPSSAAPASSTNADGDPGARHRRHRQRGRRRHRRRRAAAADGIADAGRQPAELGPLRRPGTAYRDELLPPGRPRAVRRGCHHVRWERYADDSIGIDRFGASAPGDEVLDRLGINVDHVLERARGAGGCGGRGTDDGTTDPALRGVRPESLAGQPEAGLPHVRPARRPARRRDPRLTSNPTIFQKAIAGSADYDEQFREHRRRRRAGPRRLLDARHRRHRGGVRRARPGVRVERRGRVRQRRRSRRTSPTTPPARRPAAHDCTSASPGAT